MKTSWTKTRAIDRFVNGRSLQPEKLLHEARLLAEPEYAAQLFWQTKTYTLIEKYSRKQLRNELDQIFSRLMNDKKDHTFRRRILKFFR